MSPETEVRLSYNSLINQFRPDISLLWKNSRFSDWARETGYSGTEFLPLRGAARDILNSPVEVISSLPDIKSGHVHYNPYATFWSVLKRREDPLRPGTRLAYYNFFMADSDKAKMVLHELEIHKKNLPVVTYPYRPKDGEDYGTYYYPWLQLHPAVFNDKSDVADIICLVKQGCYEGIVWDTFHASEQTADGSSPFVEWKEALSSFLKAGVVKEIHIQAARVTERYAKVPDFKWARELAGDRNSKSRIGKLIKMVKEYDPKIPFVVEISPFGLYKAGLIKPSTLFSTSEDLKIVHRKIIEYIKNI
jgi:hypothetical protein